MNHDANAFVGLVVVYVVGSLLILAVPKLRSSRVFSAVPTWVAMLIIASETVTLTMWLHASLDESFDASPFFLRFSSAAYAVLIVWLVVAPASSWIDVNCCRGAHVGLLLLVVLWIAWSAAFTLAFMHTSPKQRPWALPHLMHRVVIDGAWTLATVVMLRKPAPNRIRF